MDREALIQALRDDVAPTAVEVDEMEEWDNGCVDWPMSKSDLRLILAAAYALEADVEKEAALKALCDRLDGPPANEIRTIFGWNATKDLHTKTTKGDT